MAAPESAWSSKIRSSYAAKCYSVENNSLISSLKAAAPSAAVAPGTSSPSSASVVFKVQYILRLSVKENPLTEFLEEKDWLETRHSSSLELPWSRDGLIIDDDYHLQIAEALTVLRVPKVSHQLIIDILCRETAAVSHLARLAPKMVVHIFQVTHIKLPLIDEGGKAIYPEDRDYDGEYYTYVDCPLQTEEEEEIDQAKFIDSLQKLIVGPGDINEKDEEALIKDWFFKLISAIERVAWQVTKEGEEKEAKEAEGKKEAYEEKEEEEENEAKEEKLGKEGEGKKESNEEEEAKKEEEEWSCPICMEIFKPEEAWSKMPCCSRVFHCNCISKWTERLKKCPWCRSSLPLVLQSAKGLIERDYSDFVIYPSRPGFHDQLVVLWHLLSESVWWANRAVHDVGCDCGCHTANIDMIRA